MSARGQPEAATTRARRRVGLTVGVAAIVGTICIANLWARSAIPPAGLELGLVDLRLAYNHGVAFSLGDGAPSWIISTATGVLTLGLAIFAWRRAHHGGRLHSAAIALVVGGAIANLLDRLSDGAVTDYLHTGWWPTFNLADTAIVCGALVAAATWPSTPAPGPGRMPVDTAQQDSPG